MLPNRTHWLAMAIITTIAPKSLIALACTAEKSFVVIILSASPFPQLLTRLCFGVSGAREEPAKEGMTGEETRAEGLMRGMK